MTRYFIQEALFEKQKKNKTRKKEVGNEDCISGEAGAGRTCVRNVTWIEILWMANFLYF